MAVTQQISPYVNRLFDDDAVRDQLGEALVRGRQAYRRARAKKTAEAVKDPRLMDHITGAVRSFQGAVRALTDKPPPKPKRRPLRTAALLGAALAVGAAAAWYDSRQTGS
jgi:hypothetical protein